MYRQFENYMINQDATLTMELKYNIREEELVECSQIKVDLLKSDKILQKFEDH